MWDLILYWANAPFLVALALAAATGVAAATGAGARLLPDLDVDLEVETPSRLGALLGWVNLGRLSSALLLTLFLVCFGVIGLLMQQVVFAASSRFASLVIALPLTLVLALPTTRLFGRALSFLLPRPDAGDAGDALVGRLAVVVTGTASVGAPAQSRVRDEHGPPQFVMIEPDDADDRFAQGDSVLIVRRAGDTFYAIRNRTT